MTIYKKWYQKKLTLHVDSVKAGEGLPLTVNSLELETVYYRITLYTPLVTNPLIGADKILLFAYQICHKSHFLAA